MKKQILSEELLRMKRLAGILSESQYTQKLNEAVEIPGGSENLLREESTSQNYLDLIDINKFSQEFGISADTLKSIIDEMQADRAEGDKRLQAERGKGYAPMSADSARKSFIEKLVIKNILIRVGRIESKTLMQKGVKPGPELGKLIKDWSDLNLEPMTPEKYNETLDKFLKEKGY